MRPFGVFRIFEQSSAEVIVRTLGLVLTITALPLAAGSPAWARVMNLEATASIQDRSDASIANGVKSALDGCVRQAESLGLSWIRLEDAVLAGDRIVLQVVATDEAEEAGRRNMVPTWDTVKDRSPQRSQRGG